MAFLGTSAPRQPRRKSKSAPVSACITWRRRGTIATLHRVGRSAQLLPAPCELLVRYGERQHPVPHTEPDFVTLPHQRQRPAGGASGATCRTTVP